MSSCFITKPNIELHQTICQIKKMSRLTHKALSILATFTLVLNVALSPLLAHAGHGSMSMSHSDTTSSQSSSTVIDTVNNDSAVNTKASEMGSAHCNDMNGDVKQSIFIGSGETEIADFIAVGADGADCCSDCSCSSGSCSSMLFSLSSQTPSLVDAAIFAQSADSQYINPSFDPSNPPPIA